MAENTGPPSRFASQQFFITASLRDSQLNFASKFVCTARPIPSKIKRSTVDMALASSPFKRLEKQIQINLLLKLKNINLCLN